MIAGDIISEIIKRMKFWGSRFTDATTSFVPNTRGNSFYLIQNRGNNLPVQIRLSNHGTYLETWTDRKELGDSVDRIDPAHSINISIVFIDNGKSITDDCESQVNCEGCALPVCKPQTFAGQNEIGRPFKVYQYVYQSDTIAPRYINALAKSIFHARHSGEYIDPLKDLPRAAKPKEFDSTNMPQQKKPQYKQTENKQYNKKANMKRTIKLRESELRRMIAESVKGVINELDWKTYANAARKRAEQGASDYDIYQLDQAANNALYDKYKITGDTHFPFAPQIQTSKGEYTWERDEDGNYSKKYPHAGQIGRYPQLGYQGDFNDTYYTPIGDNLNDEPYQMTTYDNFPMHKERHKDMSNYFSGKSKYVKGKGWQNESISRKINRIVSECIKRNIR